MKAEYEKNRPEVAPSKRQVMQKAQPIYKLSLHQNPCAVKLPFLTMPEETAESWNAKARRINHEALLQVRYELTPVSFFS